MVEELCFLSDISDELLRFERRRDRRFKRDHAKARSFDGAWRKRRLDLSYLFKMLDDETDDIGEHYASDQRANFFISGKSAALVFVYEGHIPTELGGTDKIGKKITYD